MNIHHIAIWTKDIEKMKDFYVKYFNCVPGKKYTNHGSMSMPDIPENNIAGEQYTGITHFAISVGSRDMVEKLTGNLRKDGYRVISNPRETGDGYFESCVSDPEGNRIEIAI